MLAISDDTALYLLEFMDRKGLEQELDRLKKRTQSELIPARATPIVAIEQELIAYFKGTLKHFKTPLHLQGSPFQQDAWKALMLIPYGETRSYKEQATAIGKPSAYRAVANANGANQIAIVIPCHRIINLNGNLGGYGGGIAKKQWLIDHEKKHR